MLKRAKELAFKAIDLKAGFGLAIEEAGGQQAPLQGDLAQWSKQSRPRTYFLMAVRVVDARDLRQCISIAASLDKLLDGVGLYAYTNDHLAQPSQRYVPAQYKDVPIPRNLELRTMLHTISNVLRSLPASPPPAGPAPEILPKTVPPPPEATG